MDLIARFDRGPHEEIRAYLVALEGQTFLELRVFPKSSAGDPDPAASSQCISLPVGQLTTIYRAIQIMQGVMSQRDASSRNEPAVFQMVDGEPTPMSVPLETVRTAGRWGVRRRGRSAGRLPLDCPVEYTVRGGAGRTRGPEGRRGRARDINRTGAQVALPERLSLLSHLHLTLHLPVGVISLPCEVVWAQLSGNSILAGKDCRHGLRFTAVGPNENQVLDRLLEGTAI